MEDEINALLRRLISQSKEQGIVIQFIQPGRDMQNGYIERFDRSYRKEILDAYLFCNVVE